MKPLIIDGINLTLNNWDIRHKNSVADFNLGPFFDFIINWAAF